MAKDNLKSKKGENVPSIAKILWYRHKIDKWSVKKISETYNISKSTLYRWFKILKDQEVNEDYIKFELESIDVPIELGHFYKIDDLLSKEYLKSSVDVVLSKEEKKEDIDLLPNSYGTTYSFALPLDPYRIFLYWEISAHEGEVLREPSLVLKVIDDTENQKLLHMILTSNFLNNNMYIPVGIPDRIYFVDLYLNTERGLVFVCRTNTVRTPRNQPSSRDVFEMYNWYNIEFSLSSFFMNRL